MQIANILLALGGDSGNVVPKYKVTPAEVAVLRLIHGDEAVTDIEPLSADAIDEDSGRPRTHRQEITRLSHVYGKVQPNGRRAAPAVAQLFPGAAARVFESFDELDLPDVFFKATGRVKPAPAAKDPLDHDGDGRKGGAAPSTEPGLSGMTVQQLREYASVNQIDLGNATKKADIVAAIEAAEAQKQAAESDEEEDGVGEMNDADENVFE